MKPAKYAKCAKLLFILTTALFLLQCRGNELIFSSGAKGGNYATLAESLRVLPIGQKNYKVAPSGGSEHNIRAVSSGQATIGLTQMDLLAWKNNTNEDVRRNVGIVLPIFVEEVHILGRAVYRTDRLSGKALSIGAHGSGTAFTASSLIRAFAIQEPFLSNDNTADGLLKLASNELHAVFVTASAPMPILSEIQPSLGRKIRLLEINDEEQLEGLQLQQYVQRTIPAGTYSWHRGEVKTVGVPSVLIANREAGSIIGDLTKQILAKKAELAQKVNKWNGIDKQGIKDFFAGNRAMFHPEAQKVLSAL